jgi:hypothetical protein
MVGALEFLHPAGVSARLLPYSSAAGLGPPERAIRSTIGPARNYGSRDTGSTASTGSPACP